MAVTKGGRVSEQGKQSLSKASAEDFGVPRYANDSEKGVGSGFDVEGVVVRRGFSLGGTLLPVLGLDFTLKVSMSEGSRADLNMALPRSVEVPRRAFQSRETRWTWKRSKKGRSRRMSSRSSAGRSESVGEACMCMLIDISGEAVEGKVVAEVSATRRLM